VVVDEVAGVLVVDDSLDELEELELVAGVLIAGAGVPLEHPASVRTIAAAPTVAAELRRRIPPSSLPVAVG
jgi:hypothetical protein